MDLMTTIGNIHMKYLLSETGSADHEGQTFVPLEASFLFSVAK